MPHRRCLKKKLQVSHGPWSILRSVTEDDARLRRLYESILTRHLIKIFDPQKRPVLSPSSTSSTTRSTSHRTVIGEHPKMIGVACRTTPWYKGRNFKNDRDPINMDVQTSLNHPRTHRSSRFCTRAVRQLAAHLRRDIVSYTSAVYFQKIALVRSGQACRTSSIEVLDIVAWLGVSPLHSQLSSTNRWLERHQVIIRSAYAGAVIGSKLKTSVLTAERHRSYKLQMTTSVMRCTPELQQGRLFPFFNFFL